MLYSDEHCISTGFLGSSPRNTLVDRGSVHVHEWPTIPSNTFAANRRLDTANTLSSNQRQWVLRVPSGHDASDRTRNGFDCRGWVDCIITYFNVNVPSFHHQPVVYTLFWIYVFSSSTTWDFKYEYILLFFLQLVKSLLFITHREVSPTRTRHAFQNVYYSQWGTSPQWK